MQLKPSSPKLKELNGNFLQIRPLPPIISICETEPIHAKGMDLLVVPPEYADLGVGEKVLLEGKNHHSVCKPKDATWVCLNRFTLAIRPLPWWPLSSSECWMAWGRPSRFPSRDCLHRPSRIQRAIGSVC